jgi:hypothetical protein
VELNEALRDAVAEPPPTSIDLDGLIGGEKRRARRQRWLTGGGVTALVVAALGAAILGVPGALPLPFAGGGAPPPCPVVSPSATGQVLPHPSPSVSGYPGSPSASSQPDPTGSAIDTSPGASAPPRPPTEACGTAATRFNGTLTEALHRALPNATFANAIDPHQAAVWFTRDGGGEFFAGVTIREGGHSSRFSASLSTFSEIPEKLCEVGTSGCSREVAPDGTVILTFDLIAGNLSTPGPKASGGTSGSPGTQGSPPPQLIAHNLYVFRPDGTFVSFAIHPDAGNAGSLPLSLDQLHTIALSPGFTLFP